MTEIFLPRVSTMPHSMKSGAPSIVSLRVRMPSLKKLDSVRALPDHCTLSTVETVVTVLSGADADFLRGVGIAV